MGLTDLKTDAKAEAEGVWFVLEGIGEFKLARLGNPNYRAKLQKLMRPHRALLNSNSVEAAKLIDKLNQKAKVGTVVLDWRNLDMESPPAYSEEQCEQFLCNPDWRRLQELLDGFASSDDDFAARDEAGKGSGNSSGGSSGLPAA